MQWLAPLGLLSLLALVLPLAIHLLSRKSGKIIKVGSLQFLISSPSARFKSLRLSELPLMLVRMALLAVLALLLARPVWLEPLSRSSSSATGWILVAPELLHAAGRDQILSRLDTLAAAGHELHLLATGFPWLNFSDTTSVFMNEQNIWSLARELEQKLSAATPVQIFASDRLYAYRGERPNLQREFVWKIFSAVQPQRWLQAAQSFAKDSLRIIIGFSNGNTTQYSSHFMRRPVQRSILSAEGMPPLEYFPRHHELRFVQSAQFNSNNLLRFPEAESIRVALVYDPHRTEEVQYLQSALRAAAEAIPQNLRVTTASFAPAGRMWENFDFIFWLKEDSLPAAAARQIERGLTVIATANSKGSEKCESWMIMPHAATEFFPRLWRRTPASKLGAPVWTDGFGVPVLEAPRRGKGWHYRFAGRFDPAWNELVLHTAFPEWLYSLLSQRAVPARYESTQNDQRRISAAQSLPQKNENKNSAAPGKAAQALHFPLWLLAVLIFGIERWMSDRKKN